jgi:pimeloyl-ACP methyl ester carboxylesterase
VAHTGLLALCGLALSLCAIADPQHPPPLGKLADVGGHRVHIYCTGQGSPTVIVASGGFSFDWGLVQPVIAQITRICTYDTAGTAWSDPIPQGTNPNCGYRVNELHNLLGNAGIEGPYILVGYSIGGLIARLYAARHPNEISGMVLVDHAFIDTAGNASSEFHGSMPSGVDSPPVLISKAPIVLDLEDDRNFNKLPKRDQELHRWALSIHSVRPTPEMAAVCFSEVDSAEKKSFPLGSRPLAVVSTIYDSPRYAELQRKLLALSRNSKHFVAENSSHMVIIDQPEIVVEAIQGVIAAVREHIL